MKKMIISALGCALITTSALAKDTKVLPIATADDYTYEFALAAMAGYQDFGTDSDSSGTAYGIELSFNCPLLQIPGGQIRQQFSVVNYDNDNFSMLSIELNPHYMVAINKNFDLGFGPGFAYSMVDFDAQEDSAFSINLGATAKYTMDKFFVAADARYAWATSAEIINTKVNVDNFRSMLKVGMHF